MAGPWRDLASIVIRVLKWATDMGRRNMCQFDGSLALSKTLDLVPTPDAWNVLIPPSFPGEARSCLQREGEVGNIRMFALLSF